MNKYLLLINESWENAILTDKEVELIKDDINGNISTEHKIRLIDDTEVEIGIIDDIIMEREGI